MASIDVPAGETTVKVTVIDNGARGIGTGAISFFTEPPILEHLTVSFPAYVFLVEHEHSKRRILFDLGIRSNFEEHPPVVVDYHKPLGVFETGEDISGFLENRGVDLSTIEAIIWSHHHPDHTGNPTGFPSTTELVVGPSFKKSFLPGYPVDPKGLVLESDYKGRNLREISFDEDSLGVTIGGFRAVDYFGDGSFYLLETPGHTIDHMAALARTSVSPSRFILMGGDLGHHVSQWRPNKHLPLPDELEPSPLGPDSKFNLRVNCCSGKVFIDVHPERLNNTPFLQTKAGHPYDVEMARSALKGLEAFDADENILVITAHDYTLLPFLNFWPKEANTWYQEDWKQRSRWEFLKAFVKNVEDKALQQGEVVTLDQIVRATEARGGTGDGE